MRAEARLAAVSFAVLSVAGQEFLVGPAAAQHDEPPVDDEDFAADALALGPPQWIGASAPLPFGQYVDENIDITVVARSPAWCATVPGVVDAAEAVLAQISSGEVWLQAWRMEARGADPPRFDEGHWRLVVQRRLAWTPEIGDRPVFFDMRRDPLPMSAGDCIGWHSTGDFSPFPHDDPTEATRAGDLMVFAYGARTVRFGVNEPLGGWGPTGRAYAVRFRLRPLSPDVPFRGGEPAGTQWAQRRPLTAAPASTWIPADSGSRIALCDRSSLGLVDCKAKQTTGLTRRVGEQEEHRWIDWEDVLTTLCRCTSGRELLGHAVESVGACCQPDHLDDALFLLTTMSETPCLHGALSLVASCAAKLVLRHPQRPSAAVAGPVIDEKTMVPRTKRRQISLIVHEAPSVLVPGTSDGESWDVTVTDEEGQNRSHRIRAPTLGSVLEPSFAPFPFGVRDLLSWWRPAQHAELVGVLSEVTQDLRTLGADLVSFVRSLQQLDPEADFGAIGLPPAQKASLDAFVWHDQWEKVLLSVPTWLAKDGRHHAVVTPRWAEFGILWDPGLRSVAADDMSFDVVCPACPRVRVLYAMPAADAGGEVAGVDVRVVMSSKDVGPPCSWAVSDLFPIEAWTEVPQPVGGAVMLLRPARPVALLSQWSLALRSSSSAEGTFGVCWKEFRAAVDEAGLPAAALGPAVLPRIAQEFDLSPQLSPAASFYTLYDARRASEHVALGHLVDKVALKSRLSSEGIPTARVLFSSYDSPNVSGLLGRWSRYALKAAHKHHGGQGVLIMDHGVDLISKKRMSHEDIQARVLEMWAPNADVGEEQCINVESASGASRRQCVRNAPKADEGLRPAILIEELARPWDGRPGRLPDEAFCFVAWGRLLWCGVMGPGSVWAGYVRRDGTPVYANTMHAEHGVRDDAGAALRPPVPYTRPQFADVVALAERVATTLGADFVRVDVFPNAGRPLVAEVSIVSGWLGRQNLLWGEIDAWMLELFRERWLEGYAQAYGSIGPA